MAHCISCIVFNYPEEKKLADRERLEAPIARLTTALGELTSGLRGIGKPEIVSIEIIAPSSMLFVSMCAEDFQITPLVSSRKQFVDDSGFTQWQWAIKLKDGTRFLFLRVTMRVNGLSAQLLYNFGD